MENKTSIEVQKILELLKAGKTYTEDIFEGQIVYCFEKGVFKDKSWQNNPYGGEGVNRDNEIKESDLAEYFRLQDTEKILEKLSY